MAWDDLEKTKVGKRDKEWVMDKVLKASMKKVTFVRWL